MSLNAASANENIVKPLAPCSVLGNMEKAREMDKDSAVEDSVYNSALLSAKCKCSFFLFCASGIIFTYQSEGG